MLYSLGYTPDHQAKRTQRSSRLKVGASPSFPPNASLQALEAPIEDQGPTSSCVGHGSSQAIGISYAAASKPLGFVASPRLLYTLARIYGRGSSSEALQDNGAMPADLAAMLPIWGVGPMGSKSSDGRFSDCTPDNVNVEPTLLQLETSFQTLVTGEYRVDEAAADFTSQIQASIAGGQGRPPAAVGIGIFVDTQNFMAYDGSSPISVIDTRDPQGGGHWIAISYYYTTASGVVILGGPNSWGPRWGKAGHWEATATCIQSVCSDCYLFNVR